MSKKLNIKRIEYPTKILIAWGEAIGGNHEIKHWLIKNGYPELGIFVHAVYNQDEARKWLVENDFPHLLALINGAEGKEDAVLWLEKFKFPTLAKVAKAADGYYAERDWLLVHDKLFAMIALRIKRIKDEIHEQNSDYHRISM
ncbi:MAG: hypothetical protein WCK02_13175 [Bacteroidota bacterium]